MKKVWPCGKQYSKQGIGYVRKGMEGIKKLQLCIGNKAEFITCLSKTDLL